MGIHLEKLKKINIKILLKQKCMLETLIALMECHYLPQIYQKILKILNKIRPDIVLLTVDRVETLAAAMSASLMNFPIAHVQGGEVTGTIDESIRHAVTKLSSTFCSK